MKSILIISHSSNSSGGGEDDLLRLINKLKGKFRISLLTPEGERVELLSELVDEVVTYKNCMLPFVKFSLVSYFKFIIKSIYYKRSVINKFIKHRSFDLCYIHSSVCIYEFLLVRKLNANIIITCREIINPKIVRNFIYRLYLKHCVKIICISDYVKQFFSSLEARDKIEIIHCGIENIREKYNLPEVNKNNFGTKKFVMIGNIIPLKDQETVIKAFLNLNNKEISLDIVGSITDRKYYNYLLELCGDSVRRGVITFTEEMNRGDLVKLLNLSFGCIIASRQEGFSLVFLESCQLGIPVISTPVGIMSDILDDGNNGLVFDPGNNKLLSRKINLLIENSELYDKISANAFNSVKGFTVNRMLDQYVNLFSKF